MGKAGITKVQYKEAEITEGQLVVDDSRGVVLEGLHIQG
jgi:hypothetical protein